MPIYKRTGKNGPIFCIAYQFQGIRRRETIGPDKKLAEIVLGKRLTEISEGRYLNKPKNERIKFEDFADQYLHVHCKNNNKSWAHADTANLKSLKRYLSGKLLHEITPLDVEKYKKRRLDEGVKQSTVNRALTTLKCLYNRAIEWGVIENNPAKNVRQYPENNKRLRYLEKEEIERLIGACETHVKPIVVVAVNTGMRRGEILNLKWREIDIKKEIIYLYHTKNSESREVPMNSIVKKTLIGIPKLKDSPYIFHNRRNTPYKDIRKAFFRALDRAGIRDFKFHDLRHTFASQLVMSGVGLNTVRELLGHKSLQMTLRYSHLSPGHLQHAVGMLDKIYTKNDTNMTQIKSEEIEKIYNLSQHTGDKGLGEKAG